MEQFKKIEKYLPKQHGNVKISNYEFVNILLYVLENSCKWRALPKEFENQNTIYMRMNRWSKNGVLEKLFEVLQNESIIKVNMEVVCLDSTSVKVHPDGTGALKKEKNKVSEDQEEDSQQKFIWLPRLTEQQ